MSKIDKLNTRDYDDYYVIQVGEKVNELIEIIEKQQEQIERLEKIVQGEQRLK